MTVLLMKWKYAPSKSREWREYISNESGNMSAMIVLLMKWEYAHPNQKRRKQVSHDCAAYEMEIRTS